MSKNGTALGKVVKVFIIALAFSLVACYTILASFASVERDYGVEQGVLIHEYDIPELEVIDFAYSNPYRLMMYIYSAMQDVDDFEDVEMTLRLSKNDSVALMMFTNVSLTKEYENYTLQLEVDALSLLCKKDPLSTVDYGYYGSYDMWYENLTITQTFKTEYGGSVDVIFIDYMKTSHVFKENSYKP